MQGDGGLKGKEAKWTSPSPGPTAPTRRTARRPRPGEAAGSASRQRLISDATPALDGGSSFDNPPAPGRRVIASTTQRSGSVETDRSGDWAGVAVAADAVQPNRHPPPSTRLRLARTLASQRQRAWGASRPGRMTDAGSTARDVFASRRAAAPLTDRSASFCSHWSLVTGWGFDVWAVQGNEGGEGIVEATIGRPDKMGRRTTPQAQQSEQQLQLVPRSRPEREKKTIGCCGMRGRRRCMRRGVAHAPAPTHRRTHVGSTRRERFPTHDTLSELAWFPNVEYLLEDADLRNIRPERQGRGKAERGER
ncbi:MAG: hypothetical protein M1823_000045 [Watsoniomyces obsoletus]|nr:MAG: hypothetical protein M1823_000045 [Watsoniomyces obsoletus]